MSFIQWNDDLVTGIAVVDQQHQGLVELLNEAAPTLARLSSATLEDAAPLLDRLVDYAAMHFKTEEDLMATQGVDSRVQAHHRETHAGFVDQVMAMVGDFKAGRGVSGDRLLSFLASWLIFHILGEDQAMARQVHALEKGSDAETAYTAARGGDLAPSTGALSRALLTVYTNVSQQNRELADLNGELARHRDHLEDMVQERTAQLEKLAGELRLARDEALVASQAKTRFLAAVSHELRTPMNAILGFSGLLQERELTPELQALAQKIGRAGNHLLELINDILDYARAGEDGQAMPLAPFRPADLVTQACAGVLEQGRKKGLRTHIEVAPDVPQVLLGDVQRLGRILRQLAENAVKFTQKGGVRVRAVARKTPGDQHRLRFLVQDTGIGIPPERQASLFDAFNQLDSRMDRHYEGVGLGLAMSRTLAHHMGGELGLESTPGKGSLFWLDLPLVEAPAGATPAPLPASPSTVATAPARHVSISPPASSPRTGTKGQATPAALDQLEALLASADTRAAGVLENSPELAALLGDALPDMAEHIAAFDFEQALVTLKTWRKKQ
ncbi:MAG: bacteriohemerythrin [Pseudomonadota bacterium]